MTTTEAKKAYLREYYARNREALRAKQAAYNEANRGAQRLWHREFYAANKERRCQGMRDFHAANPDYRKEYNDAYYAKNRAGFIQRARQRDRHISVRATPSWADAKAIQSLYDEAARLTAQTGVSHEVDHDIPLKHPLVCGLHVQGNLVVLTRAANRAKRNHFNLG